MKSKVIVTLASLSLSLIYSNLFSQTAKDTRPNMIKVTKAGSQQNEKKESESAGKANSSRENNGEIKDRRATHRTDGKLELNNKKESKDLNSANNPVSGTGSMATSRPNRPVPSIIEKIGE